jgi:tRNA A37 threonylcarbamoyladenosine synthetase subunit TsaC/SUA5/YrdC
MSDVLTLTLGGQVNLAYFRQIRQTLEYNGFGIVPSDTGYSLAALPFSRPAIGNLRLILDRPHEPISLAFGSLRQMQTFMALTAEDERIIDTLCPGPMTLICSARKRGPTPPRRTLRPVLSDIGTVGVRLSDSPVERQLCVEMGRPLTTAAIRYPDGSIVQKFDDAYTIINDRLDALDVRTVLFKIRTPRIKYSDQSTIITTVPALTRSQQVLEYRPGIIDFKKVQKAVRTLSYADMEGWT